MSALTSSPNTYAHHGPRVPDYHSGGFYFAGVRYKSQYGSMLTQPCRVQKKTANLKKCTNPVAAMAALYEINSEYRTEMKKRYQALMFRCEHPWARGTPYEVKENFKFSSEVSYCETSSNETRSHKARSRQGSAFSSRLSENGSTRSPKSAIGPGSNSSTRSRKRDAATSTAGLSVGSRSTARSSQASSVRA